MPTPKGNSPKERHKDTFCILLFGEVLLSFTTPKIPDSGRMDKGILSGNKNIKNKRKEPDC